MTGSGDIVNRNDRPWNPLAIDPVASRLSSYAAFQGGETVRPLAANRPAEQALCEAHDQVRRQVLGEGYPCVGARSAFNRLGYRFGLFPELASEGAVRAVCHDLYEFCHEFPVVDEQFITFIAMFRGPQIESEQHFEDLLWRQVQSMHGVDSAFFSWDKAVNTDSANKDFSFSIGGRAMFIVGLHPKASRLARTVTHPTLVFNLHEQFERLRERGKFETMKQMIRARDMAFQGSINPVLKNFGESSEARQYSGRAVPDDWKCPFHANQKQQQETK